MLAGGRLAVVGCPKSPDAELEWGVEEASVPPSLPEKRIHEPTKEEDSPEDTDADNEAPPPKGGLVRKGTGFVRKDDVPDDEDGKPERRRCCAVM
mmetsp:Transcript_66995/g.106029  ORF Transcript_66995/g.106029 Transcript_66995/m.106029 type:complete len:95 (-) Transcript_66995:45-329(-)